MSGGSDNIFSRWSRRKQAIRHSETPPPDKEENASGIAMEEGGVELAGQQIASAEPDAAEPAQPLPRLEDLTAESDLSAFLREGVPKALKSAAMRKMWSLDPAIRDYIGPSEYAWDFNQPGSMGGFGPLDDAGQSVADFLSTMSGGARAGLAKAITAPETPSAPSPQQADAVSAEEADVSPDSPHDCLADTVSPEELPEPPRIPTSPELRPPDRIAAASEPAGSRESSRARPQHGRAMPR